MKLTAAQRDRAVGALLATAAGDAMGAGYEFRPPMPPETSVAMIGGGVGAFTRGEWTDDTSMAIAIAEVAATGADLRDQPAQDQIVKRWAEWAPTAKDIGIQTRQVLGSAVKVGLSAASALRASVDLHDRTGHTAGNGSLMRTAPVALAYLDNEDGLVEAARVLSELTHYDPGSWRRVCAVVRRDSSRRADRKDRCSHRFASYRPRAPRPVDSTAGRSGSHSAIVLLRKQRVGGQSIAGRLVGDCQHSRTCRRPRGGGVPG